MVVESEGESDCSQTRWRDCKLSEFVYLGVGGSKYCGAKREVLGAINGFIRKIDLNMDTVRIVWAEFQRQPYSMLARD